MPLVSHIHFQSLPATDPARARDFYRDVLGFTVDVDAPYGETRWIFMRPPAGGTLLHFDKVDAVAVGQKPALVLISEDVDAACTALAAQGVTITAGPDAAPWAPQDRWATILDSEGNLVLIQTVKEAANG